MSDTRRRKGKGAQSDAPDAPTKQDYEVAKYLRNKCPKKQTKFFEDKVYYFTGSKAVDALMESKWAKGNKKDDQLFRDRESCVDYLNKLLRLHLFIRGEKFEVEKKAKGKKSKDKTGENETAAIEGKDKKEKSGKKEKLKAGKDEKSDEASDDEPESPKTDAKDSDKKKKKKIRLETHPDQVFLDSSDAYVWMYEPTSIKNIAIGAVIVLGSIGACLFPLWPPIVRQGVYYLSLGMVGLLGLLIGTALFRYVVFGVVWALTGGKYSFWYLPNLTEDCGFFDSFKPGYTLTKKGEEEKGKKSKKAKKSGKSSDKEDENDAEEDKPELENEKNEKSEKNEKNEEKKEPKSPSQKSKKSVKNEKSKEDTEDVSKSQKSERSPKADKSPKLSPQVSLRDKDSDNGSTASDDAFEVINASPENDS